MDRKIGDLQALRRELDLLLGQCRRGALSECRIIGALATPKYRAAECDLLQGGMSAFTPMILPMADQVNRYLSVSVLGLVSLPCLHLGDLLLLCRDDYPCQS